MMEREGSLAACHRFTDRYRKGKDEHEAFLHHTAGHEAVDCFFRRTLDRAEDAFVSAYGLIELFHCIFL